MRLQLPYIHVFSFLAGLVLATILWWIFTALRPVLHTMGESLRNRRETAKGKTHSLSAVEQHYCKLVLKQAQGQHLAAPLFSLDEIALQPVLLAPPPRVEPGNPVHSEDMISRTIPYLPAWPELASIYHTPTLTLAQVLSGDSDIIITGQPGTGKTVALAYLASRTAQKDPQAGLPKGLLPFFYHIADLDLPLKKPDEPLAPIIEFISERAPILDLQRIPEFVQRAFNENRALLLLDGADELTPDGLQEVVKFIKAVKKAYPKARIVTTASPEYLDGLVSLNFVPFTIAAWSRQQRAEFLEKWGELWDRFIALETWTQTGPEQVDPILLNNWLLADSPLLTPLELTLKAWGVYAGDLCGPHPMDAIETHLRRLTPAGTPTEAVEVLAAQIHLAAEPIFDPHEAREWIKSYEPPEPKIPSDTDEISNKRRMAAKSEKSQPVPSLGLISRMANSGLLTQYPHNRMRFVHPVFSGYLAGKALGKYNPDAMLDQPSWSGKFLALHYFAAHNDATELTTRLLSMSDRPFERNSLMPGHWLRDAPRNAPWRGQVMAKLARLLQQEGLPLGLRGEALSAFIASGDPGIAALFRQLILASSSELVHLCALGCGAIEDPKAINDLAGLINHPSPNVRRAACLALVNIGSTAAIDAAGSALLHGDEDLRRAVAEALAFHPLEGHPILREGSQMEDIPVRRAVVYGLSHVNQPWANELLSRLQIDDKEWIVRTAATEVIESKSKIDPHIPRRLPPPSESPWLIAYAGKHGIGISPGKPPIELLLSALRSGTAEEKMAALSYLRMAPSEGVFGSLYQALYGSDPELREAVFLALWEMATWGINVPDPHQFGVG